MTRQGVIAIIVSVLLSLAAAFGATRVQLQDIDTREHLNSQSAERAIERVGAAADKRIDKVEENIGQRLDKVDENIQWLVKQQSETSAILRRLDTAARRQEDDR